MGPGTQPFCLLPSSRQSHDHTHTHTHTLPHTTQRDTHIHTYAHCPQQQGKLNAIGRWNGIRTVSADRGKRIKVASDEKRGGKRGMEWVVEEVEEKRGTEMHERREEEKRGRRGGAVGGKQKRAALQLQT